MLHASTRLGDMFYSVAMINCISDQLMWLFTFPEEVCVSKIVRIQGKLVRLFMCLTERMDMVWGHKWCSSITFLRFFKAHYTGLWITTVYPITSLMKLFQEFLYIVSEVSNRHFGKLCGFSVFTLSYLY